MESFHQTKAAVTCYVGFCAARSVTAARLDSTNRSSSSLAMLWRGRWATFFPKSARKRKQLKKQSVAKKNHLTKRSTKAFYFSTKRQGYSTRLVMLKGNFRRLRKLVESAERSVS